MNFYILPAKTVFFDKKNTVFFVYNSKNLLIFISLLTNSIKTI